MKVNMPVTDHEIVLRDDHMIVSETDLKGIITYCNHDFKEISGFSDPELIGKNHNLVRHPDMPPAAFKDLWDTVKAGRPWRGIVKNRAKNGDFYWVEAHVTPLREGERVTGYMSVRYKPSREQIRSAEELYRAINAGNAPKPTLAQRFPSLAQMSIKTRLTVDQIVLALWMAAAGYAGWMQSMPLLAGVLVSGIAVAWLLGNRLVHAVNDPVNQVVRCLNAMAQGNYRAPVDIGSQTEIGRLQEAAKSAQIRLGFNVAETQRVADEALRVKIALDNVSTGVMIADEYRNIIYTNKSVVKTLKAAEDDLRKMLPSFSADDLLGKSIDRFHQNPSHQARLLDTFQSPYTANLTVGPRHMRVIANPVINDRGERLGSVAEWTDLTQEVAVQGEVNNIVQAGIKGDFSQRLSLDGKDAFFRQLSSSINEMMETSEVALSDLAKVLAALAQGDLTQRIERPYEGMFGQLKDDTNQTIYQLTDIIQQIKEATDAISTAAREISMGNADLSHRTEQQASSLEETASSMEELSSTVKQNADNARQANQMAVAASDVAVKGGDVVEQVVGTMSAINESSRKIVDIISVIDGIAFQTNILALNAAVEAARAGEQGRGFAVVAGEVRNLAQRSAAAAKEIKTLINDSVDKVSTGTTLVEQAGSTIREVVVAVKRVTDIMSEISAASSEQSSGIDQVNQAITHIDEATQQNAALVEQAAAAAESMEEQANNLTDSVSRFRVEGGSRARAAPARPAPAKRLTASAPVGRSKAPPAPAVDNDDEWAEF
jgi:methyl-accepting chemotaxis protein